MSLLFGRGEGGGLMNVIRCDQEQYMVWKWRPLDQELNSTTRENSIRYGSSLRVKEGEVAVFVYNSDNGPLYDFIEGPHDQTIKTANFPVLANLVGLAYGGESPFQAEVYFINLAENNQLRFAVPYFDVFDPRLPDHGVPMSVHGTITFNISNYKAFIKLNRLINFDHDQFRTQIHDAVCRYVKVMVMNLPQEMGVPVVQMERQLFAINERVAVNLKSRLESDFGVNLKGFDIASIDTDKDSPYYIELRELTAGNTAKTMSAQVDLGIENMQETQRINLTNMEESMRIQREEAQRAQRLQTESNFMGAHSLDQQTEVLKEGAQSLGQMGTMDNGGEGGGMNAAGMMTGMMMGGAMGQQMAGMMQNMGQQMHGAMNTPPPMPNVQFHISVNGAQSGPFGMPQLKMMAQGGQLTPQTYVWKQGMPNWDFAGNVPELAPLFSRPAQGTPPPSPPIAPAQ